MRSREEWKKAWRWLAWEGFAVALFLLTVVVIDYRPWSGVCGSAVAFLGAGYLAFHEARPQCTHWRWLFDHPDESFQRYLSQRSWLERGAMRVFAICLGKRDHTCDVHLTVSFPREVLARAAGFGIIAIGTLVQTIASWPSAPCP